MPGYSYQLYSSRNFGPIDATLRMVVSAGYTSVEGYGALYADPTKVALMKAALAETGLTMPSGHFGLDHLAADPAGVIAIAQTLGIGQVYCPYLMPEDRPIDAAGWRDFGAQLASIGAPIRDAGLVFGWHNHDFEFIALPDGTLPIDLILDHDLTLEFDVAWAFVAGRDPMDTIARYGSRITAAHIKDRAPAGANPAEGGWADLGQGQVDWPTLLPALRDAGCGVLVMEHDNPSDDARFARVSIAHAKTL